MIVDFFYQEIGFKMHSKKLDVEYIPRVGEIVETVFKENLNIDTFRVKEVIHFLREGYKQGIEVQLTPKNNENN